MADADRDSVRMRIHMIGLNPSGDDNILVSASSNGTTASVSYTDVTTGEFAVTELPLEALPAELTRLHPAEILYPDNQKLPDGIIGHTTPLPAWKFEPGKCNEVLLTQFKSSTLDGFGSKANSLSVRAAGAIIQYLKETQPDALNLLNSLRAYSLNEFMTLDSSTRRNLELDETLRGERKGSLLGTLDATITPMGKRMIHQWVSQPLLNVERVTKRQNGVEYFVQNGMVRAELRNALKPIADLERLINRVIAGQAQPRDLVAMRSTISAMPIIVEAIEERPRRTRESAFRALTSLCKGRSALMGTCRFPMPKVLAQLSRFGHISPQARPSRACQCSQGGVKIPTGGKGR